MTDASDPIEPLSQPILDRPAFERFTAAYRRELKLHCYRMMGSLHEADDLVQDTFLSAWRNRSDFDGRGSLRGWLYTIATNSCLNALKSRARARRHLHPPGPSASGPILRGPISDIAWLEPYPDSELPDLIDQAPLPDARYETREAVHLAFVAAIQLLPPRQRAALLLCDVLGCSAAETAQWLGGTPASINSALQRARATLAARYPRGRPDTRTQPTAEEGRLVERYMQAWQAPTPDSLIALLRDDATYSMPPWGDWYEGREAIRGLFDLVWNNYAGYRTVATGANAQPAVAVYACTHDDRVWRAHSLHVIEAGDGGIASLTVYIRPLGPDLFAAFGLASTLP